MTFLISSKATTFMLICSYLLGLLHTVKCQKFKKIDIKELLKQKIKDQPTVFVTFNEYPDDNTITSDLKQTISNAQVQAILNKIDDIEKRQRMKYYGNFETNRDMFRLAKKYLMMRKGKSESSSDSSSSSSSSETNEIYLDVNDYVSNPKQTLISLLRKARPDNETKDADKSKDRAILNAKDDEEKIKNTDVATNNITLRFGGSCNKGASKACSKACKGVLKNVCDEYKCSHGLKSRFKTECKRNCRNKFTVTKNFI